MKTRIRILKLNWNELHVQSREEICWGAMISEKLASVRWEEFESWVRMLLADSMERRSRGKVTLTGETVLPQSTATT
jgi:hypothetical protein